MLATFQDKVLNGHDFTYYKPEAVSDKYVDIPTYYSYETWENQVLEESVQKEILHGYYACVSYVDDMVGKLLAKLNEKGLTDNTIIVLYGDHGYHLGDHNQWGKHTNFEQSTRVPLIVFEPGQQANVYDYPVDLIDMFPTICDLTDNENPNYLQGKSLKPVINNDLSEIKECAVTQFRTGGHMGYAFRDAQYRYTIWMETTTDRTDVIDWTPSKIAEEELYDYVNDPLETENLIGKTEYASAKADMLLKAENWWNEQRDYFLTLPVKEIILKEDTNLILYPNPTTGKLIITGGRVVKLKVYDTSGKMIKSISTRNNKINISNLKNGMYILQIRLSTGEIIEKKVLLNN